MRHKRWIYTGLMVVLLTLQQLAAVDLYPLLEAIEGERSSVVRVDIDTLTGMLEYAEENEHTIFELLNQSAMYLKPRGWRVRIDGDDLRALNLRFDLGGERVNTLLPVEKIRYIEIGSPLGKKSPEMEVFLDEKHSDFLELGDFFLSEHFGFETLENDWYRDGFGVKVKYLFMNFRLEGLNLYEKRKIAIWVDKVPRPKRWRIDPIRER